MTRYVVTVVAEEPDDGSRASLRVDVSSGTPRVTEMTITAGAAGSLVGQELPGVDLAALVSAFRTDGERKPAPAKSVRQQRGKSAKPKAAASDPAGPQASGTPSAEP